MQQGKNATGQQVTASPLQTAAHCRPEQTSTLQPARHASFDDEWCCACSLRKQDTSLTHRNLARISCLNAAGRQACPISSRSRKA